MGNSHVPLRLSYFSHKKIQPKGLLMENDHPLSSNHAGLYSHLQNRLWISNPPIAIMDL